ncbi:MAG: HAD family hydrolase [Planctomycetes bacterium]|nr:HAD family hydrolase [Planctomycetota bacterium]
MPDPQQELRELEPEHEFFIGIDSDGCAFDTMEIKHKECFCPQTIRHYHLQAVSKYARETWDFVNLYSKTRGCNRFLAILRVLDLLRTRKEVLARGVEVGDLPELRRWTKEETRLGNPALKEKVEESGDPELTSVLAWSEDINAMIAEWVHDVPPFPLVRESLEKAYDRADMIVVSQTPYEALAREWEEHRIEVYVRAIAGQEYGKKSEHIELAAGGKYDPEKMLMIGDAMGDHKAGKANNALFYPIVPGHEEESWRRFHEEALEKFFGGTYKGGYEAELMKELDKSLPEEPPWQKSGVR